MWYLDGVSARFEGWREWSGCNVWVCRVVVWTCSGGGMVGDFDRNV